MQILLNGGNQKALRIALRIALATTQTDKELWRRWHSMLNRLKGNEQEHRDNFAIEMQRTIAIRRSHEDADRNMIGE